MQRHAEGLRQSLGRLLEQDVAAGTVRDLRRIHIRAHLADRLAPREVLGADSLAPYGQAGFSGHTVEEACNGKEALEAIQSDPPGLVLTDWAMPEMTGIELLQALQEQQISVKIGVVTSQGTPEMRKEASEAGAMFLLTKPFTADEFGKALEPVLG